MWLRPAAQPPDQLVASTIYREALEKAVHLRELECRHLPEWMTELHTAGFIFTPCFWRKLNGFECSSLFVKFKRGDKEHT
jgi:hypothetical protein